MTEAASLRFVVLEHDWGGVHYDLMLERDGMLKTWRIAAIPDECEQEATELPDHRLAYLDYEGPVSGGRGTVRRVAAGTYTTVAAAEGLWRVRLEGALVGELLLSRKDGVRWSVQLHRA